MVSFHPFPAHLLEKYVIYSVKCNPIADYLFLLKTRDEKDGTGSETSKNKDGRYFIPVLIERKRYDGRFLVPQSIQTMLTRNQKTNQLTSQQISRNPS